MKYLPTRSTVLPDYLSFRVLFPRSLLYFPSEYFSCKYIFSLRHFLSSHTFPTVEFSTKFFFRLFLPQQHIVSLKCFLLYISSPLQQMFLENWISLTLLLRILNYLTTLIVDILSFFLLYLFTLVFISSIELILQVSSYFIPQAYYLLKRISPNLSIFFIMYSPIKHFSVLKIILTIRGLSIPYFLQSIFHFRVCFHHAYLLLLVSFPCNIFSLRSFYSFTLFTLEIMYPIKCFPFREFILSECLP